ncbi:Uncharacterised protein [Candidatus Gugararchaeum adminiculabundum]|nr:Uncharacterised protein [Candidatus Gugararchaeum adminiculabundum]
MGSKALFACLIFLIVLTSGCTLSRGRSTAQDSGADTSSALVRDSPGVPGNSCITQYLQCVGGYRALTVSCSSGYNYTEPCPKIDSAS